MRSMNLKFEAHFYKKISNRQYEIYPYAARRPNIFNYLRSKAMVFQK